MVYYSSGLKHWHEQHSATDMEFNITVELAALMPMKGTATWADL